MKAVISFISILALALPGCRQNDPSSPPKFTGYTNNPILRPGEPGSWDDLFVCAPRVIRYENLFYLFYMGCNESGRMAVGLATSHDGFSFSKYAENPVLAPDNNGFDAFTVGPGIILKENSSWVMYYNCQELAGYTPGPSVGRATAEHLTGPWFRGNAPVITSGKKGEWDDGFIIPCSVMKLANGTYRLYYTGGREITTWDDIYIGMAVSKDGFNWKKYNDPSTTQPPFSESDPVFKTGEEGSWDDKNVWMANVTKFPKSFKMFFSGSNGNGDAIGYAESKDGIHWERYQENPVYEGKDDPDSKHAGGILYATNPYFFILDTICRLYYDHGTPPGTIGVATAPCAKNLKR